jgi:hypothetical protein
VTAFSTDDAGDLSFAEPSAAPDEPHAPVASTAVRASIVVAMRKLVDWVLRAEVVR